MKIEARSANASDIEVLCEFYANLTEEMVALHGMWPVADGLNQPLEDSFREELQNPDSHLLIGEIDGVPLGFLLARTEPMLDQAEGELICAIRLIYVEHEAREVSVGEVMRDAVMEWARECGISKFDAHVLPGHRLAKNFFESGGFSARSIVMHHDDNRE